MFTLDASTLYPNNWKINKNNKVFKIKSCPVYFIFIGQRLGSIKNNILGAIINCWRWFDIEAAKLPKNILGTAILVLDVLQNLSVLVSLGICWTDVL